MASTDRSARNEQHMKVYERFTKAVQAGDAETLREICTPDFAVFEPDIFDEPIRGVEDWCVAIGDGSQGAATFDVVGSESIADALVVELNYTPPEGGEPQLWKLVYCFEDGRMSRQDAEHVG